MKFKDLKLGDKFSLPDKYRIYVKADNWISEGYTVNTLLYVMGRVEEWDPFFGPIFVYDEQEVFSHE